MLSHCRLGQGNFGRGRREQQGLDEASARPNRPRRGLLMKISSQRGCLRAHRRSARAGVHAKVMARSKGHAEEVVGGGGRCWWGKRQKV